MDENTLGQGALFDDDVCHLLVDEVRARFGFDFVGISIVNAGEEDHLTWRYVSGNTNNRYQRIVLSPGFGIIGTVYQTEQIYVVQNILNDIPSEKLYQYPIGVAEGLVSFFSIPLWKGKALSAILLCAYRQVHTINETLISQVGHFVASRGGGLTPKAGQPVYIEHAREGLVHDISAHRVIQAQEAERKRISRELHDGLSQEILLVQMKLRQTKYHPDQDQSKYIEEAIMKLGDVLSHVKSIASGLRPLLLDELGLPSAIRAQCETMQPMFGVTMNCHIEEKNSLPEDAETVFFRVFQEAAMNACKYSQSENIGISFVQTEGYAELMVKDYGIGFNVEEKFAEGSGLGLEGMNERAELVGGKLYIDSSSKGTTVILRAPLERSKNP